MKSGGKSTFFPDFDTRRQQTFKRPVVCEMQVPGEEERELVETLNQVQGSSISLKFCIIFNPIVWLIN